MKLWPIAPLAALLLAALLWTPAGILQASGSARPAVASPEWTTPEAIPSLPADEQSRNPVLAADVTTGRLHLVWEAQQAGTTVLRYAYRDPADDTWHVDATLNLEGDSPALALDDAGEPHIVYANVLSHTLQIFHSAHSSNGWSTPRRISATAGHCTDPDVALIIASSAQESRDLHVVWSENLGGEYQIYYAYSSDSGDSWETVQPIPNALGQGPAVTLDPEQHELWAAWLGTSLLETDTKIGIRVISRDASGWGTAQSIGPDLAGEANSPDIASDSARVHLIWEQVAPDDTSSVYYALHTSSTDWSVPVCLSKTSPAEQPALAVGPGSEVCAAWDAGDSLSFCSIAHDAKNATTETIVYSAAGVREVTLALDGEGFAHAAWSTRNVTGTWSLAYSRRLTSLLPSPTPTKQATLPAATDTPDPTHTATATTTPSATPSGTPSSTPEPSHTPSPSATATPSTTPSATAEASPTATLTDVPTATPSPSRTPLPTPSPTPTAGNYALLPLILGVGEHRNLTQADSSPTPSPTPTTPSQVELQAAVVSWNWSSAENVSSSSYDSQSGSVATAPDGTVYAVWAEQIATGRYQLAASIQTDGVWSTPTRFYLGQEPDLAVGPDGRVHLVYSNETFGNREIYYTYWTGSNWQASKNISNSSGASSQPAIAVTSDGELIVVWSDVIEESEYIQYAWQSDGAWNTYRVSASTGGSNPDIAVGEGGRVWVAWQVLEDDSYADIYAIYGTYNEGITWSQFALNISDSAASDSTLPCLAGAEASGTFLVWQEQDAGGNLAAYYADNVEYGEFWGEPTRLSSTEVQAQQPVIATGIAGAVHVGWDQGSEAVHIFKLPNSTWSTPATLANDASDVGDLAFSVGPDLALHALWSLPLTATNHEIYIRQGAFSWPVQVPLPLVFK